jgi:eukaryotic-like serine/threonine-protein kinase
MPDLADLLKDHYVLEHELGRGGMATVFLVRDLKHDRPVALKLLNPGLAAVIGTERFTREIRLAARLQHPHICSVYDSGNASGHLWFTMPYVEGESLDVRLAREGRLPVNDALRIAREAAQALAYAHAHDVIHRDIKPANLLLAKDGSTLVADFGIARALGGTRPPAEQTLTESGFSLGTPAYMSPEQAAGVTDLDGRSDVYSLGVVLYEMLIGERPFKGSSLAAFAQSMSDPVPRLRAQRPEVPATVDQVLRKALAFRPDDRFATMAEFGEALDGLAPRRVGGPAARLRDSATWRLGASVVVLVAILLAGVLVLQRRPGAGDVGFQSAAVLPFADLSPGKDQEYFSDGLTEELTNALSRLPGLKVAARSSAFQFRGSGIDVREVGHRLGVGTVIEGSVRRSGDRLRVSAQLVNASNGYELWSESYDRDMADIFAVQEEIAHAIVSALKIQLSGAVSPDSVLVNRPTHDLEAYDLYLKGQFALNQRNETTLPEAVRYFEQAVARDSGFARAWAGLADANVLLPLYTGTSPTAAWARAKAAGQRAIALGAGLAEAHTALAYGTMLYEWNWAEAERQFQRAIAADPNYPTARQWYGDFLIGRGRLEESLREMQRAHELDPLSRIIGGELGWVYTSLRRFDEADSAIQQVLRLDPNFAQAGFAMGLLRQAQGRPREAVEEFRHALDVGGFNAHTAGALISAYAAAGDRGAATALLDTITARSVREYIPPFAFAVAYAGLGDSDRAFSWLERGIRERDALLPENFFEPLLDPLKGDRRYAGVVARLR